MLNSPKRPMGLSVLSDTDDSDREATTGPKIRLIPNSIVNVDGRECVVERRLGNLWQLLTLDREPLHYSDADLVASMAEGKFFVVSQSGADRTRPEPLHPLNVGETAHAENMRKLEYVMACKQHPDFCLSRRVLNPIMEAVEERLRKENPSEKCPAFSTLVSWIKLYEKYGLTFGAAALSNRHDLKGRYGERLAEYQRLAIEAGIKICLTRGTKVNAYQTVLAEVMKYDREGVVDKATLDPIFLDDEGHLKPPSPREFGRRCDRVDPMIRDAMRIGAAYVRKNGRTFGTNALPDEPYKDVEVDHCTLDLLVKHPTGVILGRPDLVVFRDRATSLIIGWGLGFDNPSYASFLCGLKSAMYGPNTSGIPNIKNRPLWYGRIQNLYHDNALHLIGNSIKSAALQLGMNLVQLEPRAPWLKGALERWFRSLGLGLVHRLPGTTLEHAVARRDYETLGQATLTIDQTNALVARWICDVYNASPTRALGFIRGFDGNVSPLDAWKAKLKDHETDVLPPRELFVALAGQIVERTIQRNGITIDHLIYEGAALNRVLGNPKHQRKGQKGGPTLYKIARDPHDLGHVYLINHHTGERIEVRAVQAHAAYAEGLTLDEHEVIVARARDHRNKKKPDIRDLVETRAELNVFAAEISNAASFKTVQRKLARWLEGNRIREMRSKVESFSNDGTDYLSQQPPQAFAAVVSAIQMAPQEPPLADAIKTDRTGTSAAAPPVDPDDDFDISELATQKAWK